MSKNSFPVLPVILGVLLVACCAAIVLFGGAGYIVYKVGQALPTSIVIPPDILNPVSATPTQFVVTYPTVDQMPVDTLTLLEQTNVPEADLPNIVCRLKNVCDVPLTAPGPAAPLTVGTQETFWVTDNDTKEVFQVTATLRYATDHAYFWSENGAHYNDSAIRNLMDTFENKIYPTDREFFGSEWTPGVDGDPHIYILYVSGIGWSVAGYYFPPDEYPIAIREHSNVHEMFFINTTQNLSAEYTYSTLAHEFQHMIHWYQDRNESELLNEGFSELAAFLNGYDTGGFDWIYSTDPDILLTDWHSNTGENADHYGANFLFANYFLNRFGEEATQALVHDQSNGLGSVDDILRQRGITDPFTGAPVTADDFFQDWTLANFIQDALVGDGRYSYPNYPSAPQAGPTETFISCPFPASTRIVNQYGVDYIAFNCSGSYTIHFTGATSVPLVPADPHSGSYSFWSNKGNSSDMTLTREFDFTGISSPLALTYWTWYDLETNYDYVYLEASTDGEHWQILNTPSGTADNPTGSSYGWAYNDESKGWIEETVDLTEFAGQKVFLRFEYVTDSFVNGEGFLVDDISVPAIGYSTDFESDNGGWTAAGFARAENTLSQTFRLALVTESSSGTTVQYIPLASDQTADIPFTVGQNGVYEVTLVVSGTTRFTRSTAGYQFEVR